MRSRTAAARCCRSGAASTRSSHKANREGEMSRNGRRAFDVLLAVLPRDLRDSIGGDLEEEYLARRARLGRLRAEAWAWSTAARIAARFRIERMTHVRGV